MDVVGLILGLIELTLSFGRSNPRPGRKAKADTWKVPDPSEVARVIGGGAPPANESSEGKS